YLTMAAKESGSDTASISITTTAEFVFAAKEAGADVADISLNVSISAAFAAKEAGSDKFTGTGDSDGQIIFIPRDVEGGIGYLIELGAWDKTNDGAAMFYF